MVGWTGKAGGTDLLKAQGKPGLKDRAGGQVRRRLVLTLVSVAFVVLVAVAVALALSYRHRDVAPVPKTPEELAVMLFGQPREGTEEPGVYQATVSGDGEFTVMCRYALVTGSLAGCEAKIKDLFAQGFKLFGNLTSISVQMDFPFRDQAGNITLEKGLTARMSRATAATVDWESLQPRKLPEMCDEWWVDDRVD